MRIVNLEELVVRHVASELAEKSLPPNHNADPPDARRERWEAMASAMEDDAREVIAWMNPLELLRAISDALRYGDGNDGIV